MARSIIQSESLNLADDFAFTGTVTGAGDVLDATTTVPSEGGAVTTNLVQGLAKAWIDINTTQVIQDSFLISSVTDHGAGDYTINLSSSFASASWAIVFGHEKENQTTTIHSLEVNEQAAAKASGSARVASIYYRGDLGRQAYDRKWYAATFGDLA